MMVCHALGLIHHKLDNVGRAYDIYKMGIDKKLEKPEMFPLYMYFFIDRELRQLPEIMIKPI